MPGSLSIRRNLISAARRIIENAQRAHFPLLAVPLPAGLASEIKKVKTPYIWEIPCSLLTGFGKLQLKRRLLIDMREGVHFSLNSAELTDEGKQSIDGFTSALDQRQNAVFLIAGHTDNTGPRDFNYELGKRRADAVKRYLIMQKKTDPFRVATVSYGETSPIARNDTRDGGAKNRRIEIFVYREIIAK